jgi:hypothetical protein
MSQPTSASYGYSVAQQPSAVLNERAGSVNPSGGPVSVSKTLEGALELLRQDVGLALEIISRITGEPSPSGPHTQGAPTPLGLANVSLEIRNEADRLRAMLSHMQSHLA